ncbi:hypothetical protein RA19_15005 [Leisingera sp. ANG-M1]|nr:hypothetical protein RA19_15005 [Leisingera sp. ANG-M1]
MYARAGRTFGGNFPLFAIFSAIPVALDLFIEFANVRSSSGAIGANLFLYALITLYSHRLLLSGKSIPFSAMFGRKQNSPLEGPQKPFMLRLVAFWLFSAVVWALFCWAVYQIAGGEGRDVLYVVMIIALVPAAPVVYVALALFGTVFPAAAALQDAAMSNALARGKKTFWRTLFRLIAGNGLFTLAALAGATFLFFAVGGGINFALETFLSFLSGLVGLFGIHLTATALCMAYEEARELSEAEVFS